MMQQHNQKAIALTVFVAAAGYFVDTFDLSLFTIYRSASLRDLGLSPEEILSQGMYLLNMQMFGMLVGGLLWGVLGDKLGRLKVLFGSIALYSIGNILNGFVTSVPQYAVLRFVTGVGLAGEIGAGITLVAELLPKEKRGIGTALVAGIGLCGPILAYFLSEVASWRTGYIVGGVLGLALLFLRISLVESGYYISLAQQSDVVRGSLKMLFTSLDKVRRLLVLILIGVPIWCFVFLFAILAPEFGAILGITTPLLSSKATLFYSIGAPLGDIGCGLLSQYCKSRKKALCIFLVTWFTLAMVTCSPFTNTPTKYYILCMLQGFAVGYWAVLITTSAESFGTNLRATVTTSVPNFIRGSILVSTFLFMQFKTQFGFLIATQLLCILAFIAALASLATLRETFSLDLNYIEKK